MSFLYIYILISSLLLGSFFNVVGLRVPLKQSIVKPRSHCPSCGYTLGPFELIPVVSYVIQGGKCRRCKASISPLYPFVELMTGVLFVFAPFAIGWTSELFIAWTLISLFVIVFVSDVKYMIIPDKVLLVFAVIFLLERIFLPLTPWWDSIAGAACGFCLLLLIAVISNGGMGGGDIKLFAVIGFALGTKLVLLSFFFATLFGAVFGLAGRLTGKLEKRKPIPFGPFIGLGTLCAYFYGETIIYWYLNSFI
ncbi:prepilin peptidase [Bacillus methanolicus]|uniref:Type 4 prepilin-like proteins leader peptide-processing enzyme n=1 Tax=Bacillus methanolicus (strain MGA3 / ATCC 53907) TaxID=796606 RepID=I3ECV0_BACMM|nr:A24 family peptidase [Bacillus methanolicus]AIE60910.1 Type 4 prepilin-like proteins leader peptide-processing enzyme [Bacillus methanolicus MGA3]EIJ84321.1 peptidase A24A domain protein [Bacillus methanolicus MGA3]